MALIDDDITIIDIQRNPDTGEFFTPRELIENLEVENPLPGLFGFFLKDRIAIFDSIPGIEIYSKDSSGNDDLQFEVITSGTPNPGQFKIIPEIGFCFTHPDNNGIQMRAYYGGLGSNYSIANIRELIREAVSDLGIDNNPDWNNPSSIAGATQSAIIGYHSVEINLTDDNTISIDSIFPYTANGEYLVMQSSDTQTFGKFIYTKGTPSNASIIEGSTNFVSGDIDNNLCLVQDTNNIMLKNRLGSALDFRVYRRGV